SIRLGSCDRRILSRLGGNWPSSGMMAVKAFCGWKPYGGAVRAPGAKARPISWGTFTRIRTGHCHRRHLNSGASPTWAGTPFNRCGAMATRRVSIRSSISGKWRKHRETERRDDGAGVVEAPDPIAPIPCLRLAAEADVVVEVEQVEPGGDVFPMLRVLGVEFVEEGARFRVRRHALFLHG